MGTLSASPKPKSGHVPSQKSRIRPYRSPRNGPNGLSGSNSPNMWMDRQQSSHSLDFMDQKGKLLSSFKDGQQRKNEAQARGLQNGFGLKILLPSEEKKWNRQKRKTRSSTPNILKSMGKLFKKNPKQKHASLDTFSSHSH